MTTEIDKMLSVQEESQIIGEFLDWLESQQIILGKYTQLEGMRDEWLMPISTSFSQLLADFFGIDLNQVEKERRKILQALMEADTP